MTRTQYIISAVLVAASMAFAFWSGYSFGRAVEVRRELEKTLERLR